MSTITNIEAFPKLSRRVFTYDQKIKLLAEAAHGSVHGTALRNDLKPSQLFEWRKQFREASRHGNDHTWAIRQWHANRHSRRYGHDGRPTHNRGGKYRFDWWSGVCQLHGAVR